MKSKFIFRLVGALIILAGLVIFPGTASAQTISSKHVEVDLTQQRLYAYDGNSLIYDFPISSGTLKHPTVTGTFYPWIKLRSTEMRGGNRTSGDFYDLPNVPYVVYFYQGYGLHGTYWHHNFGHPMSHGCINLPTSNAAQLYNWIDMNTPIHIYGTTPAH